jgi:hypothetical protein
MFLVKAGLSKDEFIGTNAVLAVMVDMARLVVYSRGFEGVPKTFWVDQGFLIGAATFAAFAGVFIGNRLIKKVTLQAIQRLVVWMLFILGLALAGGVI